LIGGALTEGETTSSHILPRHDILVETLVRHRMVTPLEDPMADGSSVRDQ
jgi:hypothetical protein